MRRQKVMIVEGKTDKEQLRKVLDEPVHFICTFGTLSEEKIEQTIVPLHGEDVYIFVDADDSGNFLRNQLKQELPNARHLYTRRKFREVANTPLTFLAEILIKAHFTIHEEFLFSDDL